MCVFEQKRHQLAPPDRVLLEERTHTGKPEHPLLEQRPTEPAAQQQPHSVHTALVTCAKRQPPVSLPNVFWRLSTGYQRSQFSLFTPPHGQQHFVAGSTAPRVARAERHYQWPRQRRGQEPTRNNGNHLQSRKLHLLDETLSSNKTCLDNSSFITRLFRC